MAEQHIWPQRYAAGATQTTRMYPTCLCLNSMHYLLLIKKSFNQSEMSKTPLVIPKFNQKFHMKRQNHPWILSFLFYLFIVKVEKSFNNLKKTQRYKQQRASYSFFLAQGQVSNYIARVVIRIATIHCFSIFFFGLSENYFHVKFDLKKKKNNSNPRQSFNDQLMSWKWLNYPITRAPKIILKEQNWHYTATIHNAMSLCPQWKNYMKRATRFMFLLIYI